MTTHVVVMTGRNVANLAPLLHRWAAGDRVVLVPTHEASDAPTDWFLQRLNCRAMGWDIQHAPLLPSHPRGVAAWFERADVRQLLRPRPADMPAVQDRPQAQGAHACSVHSPLQLVGNGGTKPLQDMLRAGLACQQDNTPVLVVYAEAHPARMLLLQDGAAAETSPWPTDETGMVTLDDVLGVCGHHQAKGRLLWSAGQPKVRLTPPLWPAETPAALGDGWQTSPAITDALRQQVAGALLDLLASNQALAAITAQVWQTPEARVDGEQQPRARWDVLLLLRNGILVHLDCSRWHPQAQDDCHAAMQALVDTTVVCLPLPPATQVAAAPGLADHCAQALRHHHRLGRRVLPWLWPGSRIVLDRVAYQAGGMVADLEAMLAPYLPPPA